MKQTRRGFLGSFAAIAAAVAVAPKVAAAAPVKPTDDPPIELRSYDAGYDQALRDRALITDAPLTFEAMAGHSPDPNGHNVAVKFDGETRYIRYWDDDA
jgi:hypothetical protein